jgi:aspartyl/asparaginyl-tRNA synthetase
MHLNEFVHVECECPGNFKKGKSIAENYIVHLVSVFLHKHTDLILQIAGI